MTSTYAIILDVVLVALLVATIVYAILLNKQIVRLRDSRTEMAELIRGLNEATAKADAGVLGMKKAAHETGEGLQKAIDKAAALRDELSFIVETGEALADRLGGAASAVEKPRLAARSVSRPPIDEAIAAARTEASTRPAPIDPGPRTRETGTDGMSRAERELMQAIENRR